MAFLPFSARAKAWEPIALELRRLANVNADEVIDPEALADKVGLRLVDARWAIDGFSQADRDHLLVSASDSWSGGVMPQPLPNGKFICIINPNHDRRRNRVTLMEEIVHIHRNHRPTGLRDVMPGLRVRDYHHDQEAEAYGVGAAVLLPWSLFFHAVNAGTSVFDMAEAFDVTEPLVEYRIKITGATNLYRNRSSRLGVLQRRQPISVPADDVLRSRRGLG
jgi:IrrE N-terminal-like domain